MMTIGVAALSVNDAMAKALADAYSPLQILFLRNVIALPIALSFALHMQGKTALRSKTPVVHLLRGFFWVVATYLFFTSITHLGLAKSTALIFLAPLLIVAIAALFLGEHADWRRWCVVALGFFGAMIIIRPGMSGFDPIAWMPVAAALMAAFLMLSARMVDPHESFWTLLLYLTGSSALISAIIVPFVWIPVQVTHLWLFLGVALFGTAGMVLMTQAFRIAPATLIAPLDYSALVWASLFGWWFWQEIPDRLTYIGAAVIVASGLLNIFTDREKTEPG
ncbi:DMT family transporter [Jannaschia sp. CCS1]|uniref:DMT family transporter n=1 Tax=Jannaschia sp. (strain CCS1) TaxID=290400 RepID=UPI0002DCFB6F|nr:DMT family transporter [Jannaschia sp. CCS1]